MNKVEMNKWWKDYPWRNVQMNLREIDMDGMDAEDFASQLEEFGATVTMINSAGILASYNSELETQTRSDYLTGDSLKEMIEACHRHNIKVIARTDFSKVRYALYEKHPEWAYRTAKGDIINYNGDVQVCLNGEYQQKEMFDVIRELLNSHPFDGIYLNMSGFLVTDYHGRYYGPCHCDSCKTKFREQFGLEIPVTDDPTNPDYTKYASFKNACVKEHRSKLIETVKGIREDIAINGVDFYRSESATEIDVDQWAYDSSSRSRRTSGPLRERVSDNASVDFIGFRYRDSNVSPAHLSLRQWQNLANAGNLSFYTMGKIDRNKDREGFEKTKEVFRFHKEHESLYLGNRSAAKAAIIYKPVFARNDPEVNGWIRALTESHVPFDEVKISELNEELLKRWDLVILADARLSQAEAKLLDTFVEQGGKLIATGKTGLASDNTSYLQSTGLLRVNESYHDLMSSVLFVSDREKDTFPRSATAPHIVHGSSFHACLFKENVQKLLNRIPDHPFGPPERCYYTNISEEPGVAVSEFGSGKAVTIPWMIGTTYFAEGYKNTLNLMQDIVFKVCGISQIAPNLSPMVELSMTQNPNQTMLHLVNTSGVFANTFFDPLPVYEIELNLPNSWGHHAHAINGGHVSAEVSRDTLKIRLDQLNEYEVIVISD